MRRLPNVLAVLALGGVVVVSLAPSLGALAHDSDSPTAAVTSTAPVDRAASAAATAQRVSPPTPPTTISPVPAAGGTPADSASCPRIGHAAVIDRDHQRGWLCTDGQAEARFPLTSAVTEPDPGTYTVYDKDRVTTSTFGGHFSYLDNFVAFTHGKRTGARIAFHAVPRDRNGNPFQPYDTVGNPAWHGDSSGCLRVLPDQSQVIWDHLSIGDTVIVVS